MLTPAVIVGSHRGNGPGTHESCPHKYALDDDTVPSFDEAVAAVRRDYLSHVDPAAHPAGLAFVVYKAANGDAIVEVQRRAAGTDRVAVGQYKILAIELPDDPVWS